MKRGAPFPVTLEDLQKELLVHAKDGRSDVLFRLAIAVEQIGSLTRYLTHDRVLNPVSRPHGTKQSEIHDAGHAIVQVMTYCALREINLQEAVNMALVHLRDKDFMERISVKNLDDDMIVGQTGCPGKVRGKAFVDTDMNRTQTTMMMAGATPPEGLILVTGHPYADARLKKFAGIVTDQGGIQCHAAIIAREAGIPCVVGTGNATDRIKDGDLIEINAMVEQGQVWKV